MNVICFCLVLLLTLSTSLSYGQTFSDVRYGGGYPALSETKQTGTLNLVEEGIEFQTQDGSAFKIPYANMAGYEYQGASHRSMMMLGGPNPIVLAGTVGVSALSYIATKARNHHKSRLTLNYRDEQNAVHPVCLMLSNDFVQRQVVADLGLRIQKFQQKRREFQSPVFDLRSPEELEKRDVLQE